MFGSNINVHVILLFHPRDPPDHLAHQENRFDAIYSIYCSSCCTYQPLPSLTCFRPLAISEDASCVPRIRNSLRLPKLKCNGRNNNVEARRIAIYTLLIHMMQKESDNPKSTSSCLFLADLPSGAGNERNIQVAISAHVVEISVFFTGNSNFLDFSLWYDHTTRSHFTIS